MSKSYYKKNNAVWSVLLCLILLSIFFSNKAEAATVTITGAMWSSTIGWIAASGDNFGLTLNDDHTITGTAWSDNIGWVSFNPSDISGKCPSAAPVSYDSNGKLSGYARAIAGSDAQGWDGCINFGTSQGATKYDVATGDFSGAAWGDVNVGWVALSGSGFGLNAAPELPPLLTDTCLHPPIQPGAAGTVTILPQGGNGPGSYSYGPWTSLTGGCTSGPGSNSCTKIYGTSGTFTSSVEVTSGGSSQQFSCSIDVEALATGTCEPLTNTSGTDAATFANVGQLVTWTANTTGSNISWRDNPTGVVLHTGSTYPIRYPTIGKKKVYMSVNGGSPTLCTVAADGLPIVNNPNFREF